jgi:hypothetical protein
VPWLSDDARSFQLGSTSRPGREVLDSCLFLEIFHTEAGVSWSEIRRKAAIAAVLVVALYVTIYVIGAHSEPYRASTRFIMSNEVVRHQLGDVKSVRLSPFGYRAHYSGTSGSAEYTLDVVGRKGAGTAYLNLRKAVGLWHVEEGNLKLRNGEAIRLATGP